MENRKFSPYLPIWLALSMIAGMFLGIWLYMHASGNVPGSGRGSGKIDQVINYVQDNYVDTIGRERLEEKSINGLLESLDPHSTYITAAEFHDANDPLLGSFEGIGVQFRIENDTVAVILPVANGPSEKLGIKAGDRIVRVDGKNIAGIKITNNDVMRKLKGPKGTQVTVSIFRRGVKGLTDYTITRDVIPTYSMDIAYMPEPGIGYIRLNNFSATTHEEVHNAIEQLKIDGMKKLVLDLRSNGGGYLTAAVDLADEFLPKGRQIVYTSGSHHSREDFYSDGKGLFEDGPLLIMIDEFTASAAEIVTGAIQDNDRGVVIGRRSFGKGLVQEQLNMKDGSAVRLTVARYYTPSGRCIQKPYREGLDKYNNDYYHRIASGELEHPDSIKFPDSLKYKTLSGRIVYGGGGIMPDIFTPVERDSTLKFYTMAVNKGLIYQWAFDYTDKFRPQLSKFKNVDDFETGFNVTDAMYKEFLDYCLSKSLKHEGANLAESDRKAKVLIKAYIGRNILDNEGFYPILNSIDQGFLKAMDVVRKMNK
jgi:carboxyl-terminal processing protease